MQKIQFGTDGWRAIIGDGFTVDNVARVASATALWLNKSSLPKKAIIGYDCRFGGEMFAETVAHVFEKENIEVIVADNYITTPMLSYATLHLKAGVGVMITASHNPALYNGYKLKGHYGGPLLSKDIDEIEALIPNQPIEFENTNTLQYENFFQLYKDLLYSNFDLEAIKGSSLDLAYDAMYGAGQGIMADLFPEIDFFRCEMNPGFNGISPEPVPKNLVSFFQFVESRSNIDCGLVTDGDADRLCLVDGKGNYIDSHHVMLLLIHYLAKYKGEKGKVVMGFSSSKRIKKMCEHYGFELEVVPIGFKHICDRMLNENILVGGEESGGIAIKGHLPERDGIWNGLTIWEFMARENKSLEELIREVYDITGSFAYHRIDLRLSYEQKVAIVNKCKEDMYVNFGNYKVERVEKMDGWKYHFSENSWVMIRPSGTEPILRTYAEADTMEEVEAILRAVHKTILN